MHVEAPDNSQLRNLHGGVEQPEDVHRDALFLCPEHEDRSVWEPELGQAHALVRLLEADKAPSPVALHPLEPRGDIVAFDFFDAYPRVGGDRDAGKVGVLLHGGIAHDKRLGLEYLACPTQSCEVRDLVDERGHDDDRPRRGRRGCRCGAGSGALQGGVAQGALELVDLDVDIERSAGSADANNIQAECAAPVVRDLPLPVCVLCTAVNTATRLAPAAPLGGIKRTSQGLLGSGLR